MAPRRDADKYQSDVHFAGLVQAATAAAGRDHQWIDERSTNGTNNHDANHCTQDSNRSNATQHELRPSKRRRTGDDELQLGQYIPPVTAFDQALNGDAHQTRHNILGTLDHVAAALFRAPSDKSHKYTRPPMSTMFSSLQLNPENFLRLQSAAKDYMLNEEYPERRDCVGQRGAGESADMVKLRLWSCAAEFLDNHGHGEQYWGIDSDNASTRTLRWPRDRQDIIKKSVPLLRRMVTNERQRKYATAARKNGKDTSTPKESIPLEDSVHRPSDLPEIEPTANTLAINDILGDAFVPTEVEAEVWYNDSEQRELDRFKRDMTLNHFDFHQLVAHIDGHLEIFHHGHVACDTECEGKLLSKLWAWVEPRLVPRTYEPPETGGHFSTFQQLFYARKSASNTRRDRGQILNQASSPRTNTLCQTKGTQTRNMDPNQDAEATMLEQGSRTEVTILVNVLSKDAPPDAFNKRVIPRFCLSADSATNLASLKDEVHKRVANASPNNICVPLQPKIRVWLPDGLVQVVEDGEWMVALLSANMIDWMDGEVRVMIEI